MGDRCGPSTRFLGLMMRTITNCLKLAGARQSLACLVEAGSAVIHQLKNVLSVTADEKH